MKKTLILLALMAGFQSANAFTDPNQWVLICIIGDGGIWGTMAEYENYSQGMCEALGGYKNLHVNFNPHFGTIGSP